MFLPVIPTPFGFGIWTSHTTPIYLGATTVRIERFDPVATCAAIERHRVDGVVLCQYAVGDDPGRRRASRDYDLTSLRVVFTGGEPLPYTQAAQFEELTGVTILQFYGSNETGMLSATTVEDPLHRRLRTAGRIVPEMQVRLFDGDRDVTESGRGQPVCRGPALSLGYLGGTDHDKLFTKDGWMRMGDICELDADGYLTPDRAGRRTSSCAAARTSARSQVEEVGRRPIPPSPWPRRWRCPTRSSASGCACSSSSSTAGALDLPDARRTPTAAGRLQGTAARTTRSARRAAAIIGRQDRQRPTSRRYPIDTGGEP